MVYDDISIIVIVTSRRYGDNPKPNNRFINVDPNINYRLFLPFGDGSRVTRYNEIFYYLEIFYNSKANATEFLNQSWKEYFLITGNSHEQ